VVHQGAYGEPYTARLSERQGAWRGRRRGGGRRNLDQTRPSLGRASPWAYAQRGRRGQRPPGVSPRASSTGRERSLFVLPVRPTAQDPAGNSGVGATRTAITTACSRRDSLNRRRRDG